MTEQDQEIQTRNLDLEIAAAKKSIALADALTKLQKSPEYKTVIEEGFFKDFAHNLVMQRAYPEMRGNDQMLEANTRKIDSVGELHHFFRGVKAMAAQSAKTLEGAQLIQAQIEEED